MNICLFTENEIECPQPFLPFDDRRAQHILKVLHKNKGDSFTAGVIDGASGTAVITEIDEAEQRLYFEYTANGDGKPLNPLKMLVGFVRPIQLRRLLRDVAALGVSELYLTGTELGEKSYMQSDLAQPDKVRELLLEGTIQAGSTHVPKVFIHKTLQETLSHIAALEGPQAQRLICLDNINPACSLGQVDFSGAAGVVAAIGSERGWTDRERALLEQAGFMRCGMGERIMRTETAVTVAGAIILNGMGRLN
ncbi:MAG: 16S rRNA (uracil(1498)-N(3))-methyltransferase [Treponema sp.]|nr:16S rRNA (uracil(1498)-N(3))-methyltransferase [Treponema sp.]